MLEFLFELVAEFVLQAVAELLVEMGLHAISEPFRKAPDPRVAMVGYALFGAVAGGLSLLAFPTHFVTSPAWRLVNLLATPLAAGALMSAVGAWRRRRGQALLRIDRFAYGFLFALALAVVRFAFAR